MLLQPVILPDMKHKLNGLASSGIGGVAGNGGGSGGGGGKGGGSTDGDM